MNSKKILSFFMLAIYSVVDASGPKKLGQKILQAARYSAIITTSALTAESCRCVYQAKGDLELSSRLFSADMIALTYNTGKFVEQNQNQFEKSITNIKEFYKKPKAIKIIELSKKHNSEK